MLVVCKNVFKCLEVMAQVSLKCQLKKSVCNFEFAEVSRMLDDVQKSERVLSIIKGLKDFRWSVINVATGRIIEKMKTKFQQ